MSNGRACTVSSPYLDCFLIRRVRLVVQKTGSAHGEVRRSACWRRLRQPRLKQNWGVLLWRPCSLASLQFLVFNVSWQLAVAAELLRSFGQKLYNPDTQHGSVAAICVILAFFSRPGTQNAVRTKTLICCKAHVCPFYWCNARKPYCVFSCHKQ